jgi:predicted ester cyclase
MGGVRDDSESIQCPLGTREARMNPTIGASIKTAATCMSHHHAAPVRRWFDEIWNRGNADRVDELLAPGGLLCDSSMADVPSLEAEAFKAHAGAMRQAIPDIRFTIDFAIDAAEHVAARVTVSGTHTGRGLGIEPTKRAFRVSAMVMAHVRDGRIVEGWNHFDLLGLFSQLGVVVRPRLGMMV